MNHQKINLSSKLVEEYMIKLNCDELDESEFLSQIENTINGAALHYHPSSDGYKGWYVGYSKNGSWRISETLSISNEVIRSLKTYNVLRKRFHSIKIDEWDRGESFELLVRKKWNLLYLITIVRKMP